jgi:small-conductance mechanosensitive channel
MAKKLKSSALLISDQLDRLGDASSLQGVRLSEGFIPLLRNLVTLFITTFGAILILKHFGYDVWSLITALGVGSLAVGLAAKDTLSHMISGFVLIIDRNLRPGDRISFSGATGTVEEIGLRSTRIVTSGGSAWIVPNSELVNTKILNFSLPQTATRISTTIKVPLQIPLEKIREIGRDALRSAPGVDSSREFEAHLVSLVEGSQTIDLSFWIGSESPDAQARVLSTFLEEFSLQARGRQVSLVGAPASPT